MAPKALLGRYKLYKAGTTRLVQWLASSASQCCDLKSIVKSLGSGLRAKPTKPKKTKRPETPVEIRTQELVKLAEAIASSHFSIDVPERIIEIVQDVIAGREECAEWYAAQALQDGGELEKENESHRYFIMVLKRIKDLLCDARARRPGVVPTGSSAKASTKQRTQVAKSDELSNLFDCLELEEPSSTPLGEHAPVLSSGNQSPSVRTSTKFQLEKDNDDDLAFATWCFLQDLNDVRCYVRETWLEYSRGDISFLAASSITDTAFGLLRCADDEFSKSQSTNWATLMDYFGLSFFSRGHAMWICPSVPGSKPRIPDSKINVVELLCPLGYRCLMSYFDDASELCGKAQDHGNPADPTPAKEHFNDFCQILYNLAPELHDLAHTRPCEHIVVDEFVQGLISIHRTGKKPMWLAVAAQIYLDIYDLLGNYIDHGADALRETFEKNRQVEIEVDRYRDECLNGMADVPDALVQLHYVAAAMNRFEESHSVPGKGQSHAPARLQTSEKPGTNTSLMERSLPAHAGAILGDLKIGMHNVGCKIANHCLFVLSMAHLYKALRGLGLLKADWHDMEFILGTFGNKQPLVAKTGFRADRDAMVRRYLLALGVPASDFAVGGRRDSKGSKAAMREARKVTITSPYLQGMIGRQGAWDHHGIGYAKHKTVEIVLQTLATNATSPVQLLATFRKAILADEPQLNFDYTTFTITCARLLQKISDVAGPQLGIDDAAEDWYFSLVKSLIGTPDSHPAAASAADLLRDHIAKAGKQFVKEAYDQSSGRIPKHLRPNIERDVAIKESSHLILRTMLDYSGTKYSFSGRTVAAYHPGIISECCTGEGGFHGGETDPLDKRHHGHQPVIFYGSAIPSAIVQEGLANCRKDPTKYIAASNQSVLQMFELEAAGGMTEQGLRGIIRTLLEVELVPMYNVPVGITPWAYRFEPSHRSYERVFEMRDMEAHDWGCTLIIPVDESVNATAVVPHDLAAPALYDNLGFNWASSLLGFIELVLSIAPVILLIKGSTIRQRSSFMSESTYDEGEAESRQGSFALESQVR
ncbi:hypothetical protein LTR36_010369 [Oleoguttula mirabilis]|uniref:DUF6604 domain-containing protein n=1 Tax=Oleoguttula mirabilis TaxID=1507867 RepID=A0AAV9J545_9PEZI|nr:hypothetical protein LTR36_010369 [Oleoguttula mirabilis]